MKYSNNVLDTNTLGSVVDTKTLDKGNLSSTLGFATHRKRGKRWIDDESK